MKPICIAAAIVGLGAALAAQVIEVPFTAVYGYTDLGAVPGVPANYGGVTFRHDNPHRLLIGGAANTGNGAIYEIQVTRDATGRLMGFAGTATQVCTAPYIDGGLCFAPNGVLMYAGYPVNAIGQVKPGSSIPDRIDNLASVGIAASTGTLQFVPPGFPGAGQLKVASFTSGLFYGLQVVPDGDGTYNLATNNGPVSIGGGPEGILYVPPGSRLIPNYQLVAVSEFSRGTIALYQLDAFGNPIPSARLPLLTGLSGAAGSCTDPITGALVFSTYGGGNRILVVHGFGVCGSFRNYGTGIAGLRGAPAIAGGGCAGRGQFSSIDIANGRPNAAGLIAFGLSPTTQPLLNGTLLVQISTTYFHVLNGTGQWSLQLPLPADPVWNGLNLYTQSFYIDPAAAAGVSATNGLHMFMR